MEFKKVIEETEEVIKEFEKRERKKWTPEIMITELTKQLGELSKQIMMLEKNYLVQRDSNKEYSHSKERLAGELSDIFYIIIRLANYYQVDLEKTHIDELNKAKKWFKENN